jgi:myxalamid-type polyketide synthase MxaC
VTTSGEGEGEDDVDVAIIGMAGRFPGAADVQSFWKLVRDAVEGLRTLDESELRRAGVREQTLAHPNYMRRAGSLVDIAAFDAGFFGFSRREADALDPQHRMLLEIAWEALEDAGIDPARTPDVGVFAGCSKPGYGTVANEHEQGLGTTVQLQSTMAADRDYLATRVSYKLGLRGPSMTVQTACSTSLVAVHLACQSLLLGECDVALAGGVAVQVPHDTGYLWEDGGLASADGHCRPFDEKASGTVFGSGGGLVVLRRLKEAVAAGDRVIAVIKGTAIGNDGSEKVGFTAPSIGGQARVIRAAQAAAGIEPRMIGYVETHGTGTPLGDPIEVAALQLAFGEAEGPGRRCALGSVKGNVGHLDTAAGVAGLIKAALAVRDGVLPPSLNFERANPAVDFGERFYVNAQLEVWEEPQRYAGVSSFGIGGTNAHAIVGNAPRAVWKPREAEEGAQLLTLSAKDGAALEELAQRYEKWLQAEGEGYAAWRIAGCGALRRSHHEHRLAVVGESGKEFAQQLKRWLEGAHKGGAEHRGSEAVWVFSGQGGQWLGMGREWLSAGGELGRTVQEIDEQVRRELGWSVRAALEGEGTAQSLNRTSVAQVAVFTLQAGLAAMWRSVGLRPAAVVGHSMGEVAAALAAEILSLDEAVHVICARGRAFEDSARSVSDAAQALERELSGLSGRAGRVPFYGTVAGRVEAGPLDARYWARNVVSPVRFGAAIEECKAAGHELYLEIGPRPALAAAIQEGSPATVLSSCDRGQARATFLHSLGRLYERGFDPKWSSLHGDSVPHVPLPGYRWQRRHYWLQSSAALASAEPPPGASCSPPEVSSPIRNLLKQHFVCARDGAHFWEGVFDPSASAWQGHRVGQTVVLPAAAILDLILTATRDASRVPLALQNVEFIEMVAAPNGSSRRLQLMVEAPRLGRSPFVLSSRLEGAATHPWSTNAKGVVLLEGSHEHVGAGDAPTGETSELEVEHFYRRIADGGIRYDGQFRSLSRIRANEAFAIGELGGAANGSRAVPACCFVALDAALQLLFAIGRSGQGRGSVPVEIDEVVLPTSADACVTGARARSGSDGCDAELVDAGGRTSLLMRGIRARSVDSIASTGADWLVAMEQRPIVLRAPNAAPGFVRQHFVLIPDGRGVARRFEALARARGHAVSLPVEAGAFAEGAAAADPAACVRAIREVLEQAHPASCVVVYLRALDLDESDEPPLAAEAECLFAAGLIRAVCAAGFQSPPRLAHIARCALPADGENGLAGLAQSSVWSFFRTVALEHAELRVCQIDLDGEAGADEVLAALVAENVEPEVAVRRGSWLAPRLVRGAARANDAPLAPLDPKACYLITGGTGGVGIEVARWMTARGARHLVLVASGPPSASAERAAETLELAGATVRMVRCDIGVREDVLALIAEIDGGDWPLRGIVHAAGWVRDSLVINLQADDVRRTMASKARGAWHLHRATERRALDFFVMFSSISSVLGAPGQASHAAANGFLDGLAWHRRARGLAALTVDWGLWADVGYATREGVDVRPAGIEGMSTEIALDALERALLDGRPQWAAFRFDPREWHKHYPSLSAPPIMELLADAPHAPANAVQTVSARLRAETDPEMRRHLVEQVVCRELAAVLSCGDGEIDRDLPFSEAALDSLMALELRSRLEASLRISFPTTAIWRHPTSARLAEFLSGVEASVEDAVDVRSPRRVEPTTVLH